MAVNQYERPDWYTRRLYLFVVTAFLMAATAYVLWNDLSTKVAESVVLYSNGGLTACLATYVFGAVVDDKNFLTYMNNGGANATTSASAAQAGSDHSRHRPSWRIRKRYLYTLSLFFAVEIVFSLYKGLESDVAETAVTYAALGLIGSVFSYVFGATWDDSNFLSFMNKGGER